MKPTVAIGFLGSTLDAAKFDAGRWSRWRPTVGLTMHEDLRIDRLVLIHGTQHARLAAFVALDIASVSPETRVEMQVMDFADPWDFEEVYGKLLDFARAYPFDPDAEDYLVHITTGTHVAQMRQHVTAIEAACAIGDASCEGLMVGSSEVTFRPDRVRPGAYRFSVGTAGSTGLVLQTVLMPLLLADGPSRLVLEGGTHNMLAPPFEFIERCFLPIVRRMGSQVEARLVRHGFYPRGGGRIEVDITPGPLRPIECLARGKALGVSACALFAGLPMSIAGREIAVVRKAFDWSERECFMRELPVDQGPGNILLLEAQFEHVTEIVSGFAQLGVTAERVAKTAVGRMRGYLACEAFAGPYLADQLLLPMALAGGGVFTTVKPSEHARTAATVIERFTGRRTRFEQQAGGAHAVTIA